MVEQYKSLSDAKIQKGCEGLALGRTEIWYMKRASFRKWNMGPDFAGEPMPVLKRSALEKDHVLLGRVKETDPDRLFMMLQGEMWSPQGEASALIRSIGLAHTSMNIGDVVVIGRSGWMVDDDGFTPLPKDEREAQEMFKKSQENNAINLEKARRWTYATHGSNSPVGGGSSRTVSSGKKYESEDVGSMRGLLRRLEERVLLDPGEELDTIFEYEAYKNEVWPGQDSIPYGFYNQRGLIKDVLYSAVGRFAAKRVQEKAVSMRALPMGKKGVEATWEGAISPVGNVVLTASLEDRGTRTGAQYWTLTIKIGDGKVESNTFGATVDISKQGPKWFANKIKDAEWDMKDR